MKALTITCLLVCVTLAARAQAAVATVKLPYGAVLTMRCVRFHPARHKPAQAVDTVDGEPIFGTDGHTPRSQLASASVLLGGVRYQLPVGRMYNPWSWGYEPNPRFFRLTRTRKPQGCLLAAMFSDGGGSYAARWLLADGKATRLILSRDEEYFW